MKNFVVLVTQMDGAIVQKDKPHGMMGLPFATVLDRRRHQFCFRNSCAWNAVDEFHGMSIMKVVQKYGDNFRFRANPELI